LAKPVEKYFTSSLLILLTKKSLKKRNHLAKWNITSLAAYFQLQCWLIAGTVSGSKRRSRLSSSITILSTRINIIARALSNTVIIIRLTYNIFILDEDGNIDPKLDQ